jgi:predicted GIY-YIG superfamily endonuclease
MRIRTHEKPQPKAKPQPKRWWIEVVEILDPDLPRRLADQPNVKVSVRISQPTTENVQTRHKDQSVLFRADLSPTKSYSDYELAKTREREVRDRLKSKGYTVNSDLQVWSVYVIELDTSHFTPAQRKKHSAFFYVGMTSKKVDARLAEHKEGVRNEKGPKFGRSAHKYFSRYRPDLSPSRLYFSQEQALRAESKKRLQLETRGYKVDGGTERLDLMSAKRTKLPDRPTDTFA